MAQIETDKKVLSFHRLLYIQFIALILRSRIYTALKEKSEKMQKKPNYLTVPAALKELEKIVMIRQLD